MKVFHFRVITTASPSDCKGKCYIKTTCFSESDNLGSTDSEVKKILTLHLPITEYEDDASDDASALHSDSEPGARLRPTHPTAC